MKKFSQHKFSSRRRRPHADRNDIGLETERQFEGTMAFYRGSYPKWLMGIRRAKRGFDSTGADYVGETRRGIGIPINIKTNERDVAAALQNYPDIPCLVVHRGERRESIYERAIELFEGLYFGEQKPAERHAA